MSSGGTRKALRKRDRPAGYTLAVVFVLLAVLLVGVVALLATAGRNIFWAARYHEDVLARQAAESGLAYALAALEADPALADKLEERLSFTDSSFSVDFQGGPVAQRSTNNLMSSSAVSVAEGLLPPHSAFVVSRGSCRGSEVTLRALVREGELTRTNSLLASQRISLFNNVQVRGIDSFISNGDAPADIHSNRTEGGTAISWHGPNSGDRLVSNGGLSTSAPDASSVSLSPAANANVTSTRTDQPPRPHFNFDIVEMVALHSSNSGPTFPTIGQLVLPPGDHYYGSSQSLQGDLILQAGARLYVRGDLTLNGSLRGTGMVAVTGFTSLKGDASLSTADGDYLAVLSKKGLEVTGFEGSAYLDALAGSEPTVASQWPLLRNAMADMKTAISGDIDSWVGELADDNFDNHRVRVGNPNRSSHQLHDALPGGETADFLRRKFYGMRLFYHDAWHHIDGPPVFTDLSAANKLAHGQLVTQDYLASNLRSDRGGIADAVSSQDGTPQDLPLDMKQALQRVVAAIDAENVDKLGSGYFKGFLYSNGPIYVANEITIVGAVESQGLASVTGRRFGGAGGVDLAPGDIYLGPRSDLVYVADLLRSDSALGRTGSLRAVYQYMDR